MAGAVDGGLAADKSRVRRSSVLSAGAAAGALVGDGPVAWVLL